jgi:hypothetical protein
MSLTILLWPGIIKLFPAREWLESDIPAGDRKIDNLFYSDIVEGEGGLQSLYLKSGIQTSEYKKITIYVFLVF